MNRDSCSMPTITCGMPFFVVLSFSTAQDPSMFKLPSHSLEIGVEYEFRVDVTDSVGYSSFATQVTETSYSGKSHSVERRQRAPFPSP